MIDNNNIRLKAFNRTNTLIIMLSGDKITENFVMAG